MAGQPTKLTPETQERICQLIRAGNTVEVASEASGIAPATYYGWMQRGQDKGQPYRGFREAVEKARAEAEAILVGRVQQAANSGSWRAATWLLERQWPENWAPLAERDRSGSRDLERELDALIQTK